MRSRLGELHTGLKGPEIPLCMAGLETYKEFSMTKEKVCKRCVRWWGWLVLGGYVTKDLLCHKGSWSGWSIIRFHVIGDSGVEWSHHVGDERDPETCEDVRAISKHEIMTVSTMGVAVKRKGTRVVQEDRNGEWQKARASKRGTRVSGLGPRWWW